MKLIKIFAVKGIMDLDDFRALVALLHIYFPIKIGTVQFYSEFDFIGAVTLDKGFAVVSTAPRLNATTISLFSTNKNMPVLKLKKLVKRLLKNGSKDFRIDLYSPLAGHERSEAPIEAQQCGWDKIKIIRGEV